MNRAIDDDSQASSHVSAGESASGKTKVRRLAAAFSDPAEPPREKEEEKKKRILRETMQELKTQISEAMANNHWVGTDDRDDSGSVKYLLSELHLCLGDCQKASRGPDELHRLSSNIAMWISDAVLQRPMFKELKGLRGCFTQFSSYEKEDLVDQDRTDKVLFIEELATVDAFTSMPNLENASVSNRTQFRNSKLYANFIEEKVHLILDNGRKDGGDTRREAINRAVLVGGIEAHRGCPCDSVRR